ncbi:MAG: 16S rRNA (cytidine(1402)-2'-O)-methyltransferase [Tissierella sp.]|uniref:16S rRNA (cytidine(1402)-2'-O)-methyltransferase n=1 Tax=Tissierella sp. TaxID=41274 RepID=UPI003F9BA417
MEKGKLYICPTPIGNLEDITIRTLKVLEEVDLIAAEDTRHSLKLLNHYDIKKPLTSYHEHNEREKGQELIEKLLQGENIAQISDAGMPGISDPGQTLIGLAIENEIEVVALPGATALITALVSSGLSTRRFTFEGFLPSKKKERVDRLKLLGEEKNTLVIYESPHRLKDTLKDMLSTFGNRKIAIVRELTKVYEEILRSDIIERIEHFNKVDPKGEFVLVIEGKKEESLNENIDIKEELKKFIEEGYTKKASVKIVCEKYDLAKNKVYKKSLEI